MYIMVVRASCESVHRFSPLSVAMLKLEANPNILCDYPALSPMAFGEMPSVDFRKPTGARCKCLLTRETH